MSEGPAARWLALCALLGVGALGAAGLPEGAGTGWVLERGRALAEPWRLWTAALWHWNGTHLAGNLAGLLALALLGARGGLHAAGAWALAWPLTQALLLLHPELPSYAGLSGVLHAGVAVAGVELVQRRPPRERAIGAALLLGLAAKLLLEAPWGPLLRPGAWWGGATLPLAHSAGALAGTALAGLAPHGRRGGAPAGADRP